MKCPLCNGVGVIKENPKANEIKNLREKGMTIREIAKLVGRSPTTVFYHLSVQMRRNENPTPSGRRGR